jgi:hypothetical protein
LITTKPFPLFANALVVAAQISPKISLRKRLTRHTTSSADRSHARAAFQKWVDQGEKETEERDPDIKTKKDAIAIIRVLLPKLSVGSPKVTLTSFKNLKDCVHWLGNIRRGTTWDAELEAILVEDDTDGVDEEALEEHKGEDGVEGTLD